MSPTHVASAQPLPGFPVPSALRLSALPAHWTLADLQDHLGGVALERIRLYPPPGLATVEDALWLDDHEDRLCELVDGVLVEKPVGLHESVLAMMLGSFLHNYLETNPCGFVTGEAGQLYILPSKMRIPDVAFISWDRFPANKLSEKRVYELAPDLAVEIISESHSRREMEKKLDEYFQAGVRLVWYIYPDSKTAHVFSAPDRCHIIDEAGTLDGKDVLPGFQLSLGELFRRAERRTGPNA